MVANGLLLVPGLVSRPSVATNQVVAKPVVTDQRRNPRHVKNRMGRNKMRMGDVDNFEDYLRANNRQFRGRESLLMKKVGEASLDLGARASRRRDAGAPRGDWAICRRDPPS